MGINDLGRVNEKQAADVVVLEASVGMGIGSDDLVGLLGVTVWC